MTAPTVPVTVKIFDGAGGACPDGTLVFAKLDRQEVYQGFIVPSEVSGATVGGIAVLNLFPNHPSTGLGTQGSVWNFRSAPEGMKTFRASAQVPNVACVLDAIADLDPAPALSSAQAAQAAAAASAGAAGASATAASASAAAAAGSASAAATSATNAATSATAAAGSASAAGTSAGAAATSAAAADTAKTAAQTAKTAAEAAQSGTQTMLTAAQTAKTDAEAARDVANNASASSLAQSGVATNKAVEAAGSAAAAAGSAAGAASSAAAAQSSTNAAVAASQASSQSAASASSSLASAIALYGSATALSAAQAISLGAADMAQSQANLAATMAASAASVAQQDLSGVTAAALHRTPNACTVFPGDFTRDSDGGAWIEKMSNTGIYNETLSGTYLGNGSAINGIENELHARCIGATLGSEVCTGDAEFNSATGWTTQANASITGGQLVWNAVALNSTTFTGGTPASATVGQVYRVELVIKSVSGGNVRVIFGGTTRDNSVTGTLVYFLTATATSGAPTLQATSGAVTAVIERFSVKPVTALNAKSGDYYNDAATGKHHRLWRNLNSWSEDFTQAAYAKTNFGFGATQTLTSADGQVITLRKSIPTAGNALHHVAIGTTIIAGQPVELSMFAAAGEYSKLTIGLNSAFSLIAEGVFDLSAGTAGTGQVQAGWTNVTTTIEPVTGGYRCIFKGTPNVGGGGSVYFTVAPGAGINNALNVSFNPDGTSGAFLGGLQVEQSAAGHTAYEKKEVATGISETFIGNKAKPPRRPMVVGEAASPYAVIVYDPDEPGRPMWRRWHLSNHLANINSVRVIQGKILVTGSAGLVILDIAKDIGTFITGQTERTFPLTSHVPPGTGLTPAAKPRILASTANAVDACVMPDAPVDPSTGLAVPTIAVFTNGGITLLQNNGTAVNSSNTAAYSGGAMNPYVLVGERNAGNGDTHFFLQPGKLGASFTTSIATNSAAAPGFAAGTPTGTVVAGRGVVARRTLGLARLSLMRLNEMDVTKSLVAQIGPDYNTGWWGGGVVRAWLCDTVAGVVAGGNIVTNGEFNSDIAGWTPWGSASLLWDSTNGGRIRIQNGGGNSGAISAMATVPGMWYEVFLHVIPATDNGHLRIGTTSGGNDLYSLGTINSAITPGVVAVFKATTATTYITVACSSGTAGNVVHFDQVRVYAVDADRSYRAKNARVNGSLTRTAVAAGAQVVFTSGFSNDAAFQDNLSDGKNYTTAAGVTGGSSTATFSGAAQGTISYAGLGLMANGSYEISYTVSGYVSGNVYVDPGGASTGAVNRTANGTYTEIRTAKGNANFYIAAGAANTTATVTINYVRKHDITAGSAANVLQESYSTDWDPGTGAFHWAGEAAAPVTLPETSFTPTGPDLVVNGNFGAGTASWSVSSGGTVAAGKASFSGVAPGNNLLQQTPGSGFNVIQGMSYEVSIDVLDYVGGDISLYINNDAIIPIGVTGNGTKTVRINNVSGGSTGLLIRAGGASNFTGSVTNISVKELTLATAQERAAVTGPYVRAGMSRGGRMVADLSDGTTRRTAASSVSWNTGQPFRWALQYEAGVVSLFVNDGPAGQTVGAPLLTLSNASAVVTVGNSRLLNAAWPGSLGMLKPCLNALPDYAHKWIWEQEREMLRDGAQVTLPSSNSVLSLSYDATQDKWITTDASNRATFTGLVRTNVAAPAAGSFAGVAAGAAGVELLVRSTTNPGVDITDPPKSLKEELYRREEAARKASRDVVPLDWTASFTSTGAPNGQNFLSSISGLSVPSQTTIVSARLSGSGIPAGAYALPGTTGSVVYLSAPSTGTPSGAPGATTLLDYILPPGYEVADDVFFNRLLQREGSTFDYTRGFDGFCERVQANSGVTPAGTVRINARKMQ